MKKLYLSDDFLQKTANSIILLNENREILKVNPSFEHATGYKEKEVIGKTLEFLRSDRQNKAFYDQMWSSVEEKGIWEGELWNRRKNGEIFLARRTLFVNEGLDRGDYHYIVIGRDSVEDKSLDLEAGTENHFKDFITGLPQSFMFKEMVSSLLQEANRKRKKVSVIFLDFVSFKYINESFGYAVGDNFLNIASERLKRIVGVDTLMSRMGGDVFALILKDILTEKDVLNVVDRIIHSFKEEPFIYSKQEIYLSTNIGISIFPNDGKNEDELFKAADLARYRAKENGKGKYQFYTPSLNVRMFERLVLETNLRKAIEDEKLMLFYQPQIDIPTGKVIGMEALVRWNHPDLGIVSPAQFIPIAEETGLILPIGKWVLQEACKQIRAWIDQGYDPITVSVNLSAKQLQGDLIDLIEETLLEYQIEPKYLELEITETTVMKNIEKAIEMLHEIEKLGITISIDDFGTGYSSLSYLAKLPIHSLKIDRSFIQNVSSSNDDATIVSAVIAMAHQLNLNVVAEGVEKIEDLHFLREQKCEKYQGFYFSPPVPAIEIEQYLNKTKK